jgi:glycosyltransferase involved in cell wall biosynthesis
MPPERLVQTLLSSDRVSRLLVVNPYRSAPRYLARRLTRLSDAPFPASQAAQLTTPLRWRRNEEVGHGVLKESYAKYDQHVRARAQRMGLQRPAVITTNAFYAAYAPLEWAGPVTYYAWDDWTALGSLKRWHGEIDEAYRIMAARGTRICAVSETLLNRIAPSGPGAVVPNGITPTEWQPPWVSPAWIEALPRPRLLYVGSIHERLDTDTIGEISRSLPDASIVVVGPVMNPDVVKRIVHLKNVHIHPPVPHSAVAGLVHGADICIMPHLRNALTEAMSPLKVYEYLATGRAVVATDLPPIRNVHERVHLVPPGASFTGAIEDALRDGPMPEADRQQFLERNSWRRRHEQILDFALA